ncbi:hypothetical protein PIB30_022748 [Stylosanthes scabra]|uniref:Uncharacterized protein n=1 Tax=Stylosanthes scabra TaxID=79078 RepID=A0ABU6Q9Q2_9FABA|nr:hypothetical protein [Stylosanthes scabra]
MQVVISSLVRLARALEGLYCLGFIAYQMCITLSSTGSDLSWVVEAWGVTFLVSEQTLMAAHKRGRGRGRGPHPPVADELDDGQQKFFAAMTNMANTIQAGMAAANAAHAAAAAAAGGGGGPDGERPMTLASFLQINPPTFQGTMNPTEADDWI